MHLKSERHNGGGNTATKVGKYTPPPYYEGPCNSAKKTPIVACRLHGGKTARVVKSPSRV